MSQWLRDLRHTARVLLRAPAFTAGVVLTLGLGLGLNAVMATMLERLLWQAPAGAVDPGRLARIYIEESPGTPDAYASISSRYPIYTDLRSQNGPFAELAAVARRSKIYGEGVTRRWMDIDAVSGSYFSLVGVRPALGRFFTEVEDQAGAEPVAVVSWAFWQRELAGDPRVLGRRLHLETSDYTIIGVAPEGFGGLGLEPAEAFLPIVAGAASGNIATLKALTSRTTTWMTIVARLAPGVTPELAGEMATPVYRAGMQGTRQWDSTSRILAGPIQELRRPELSRGVKQSLWIGLAAFAVLLVACVNITNLLLARGMTRERELAIRASLGAGRAGLVRVLLSESLLLALAGGACALLVALWSSALLRDLVFPWLPDAPVFSREFLLFLGGGIGLTTLLIGGIPALQLTRFELARGLRRAGARGATSTGQRTRSVLLSGQIALTLLLLIGAGLFLRSLRQAMAIDSGFDGRDVYEVVPRLTGPAFEAPEAEGLFQHALLERLQADPAIASVGLTRGQPFATAMRATGLRVEGRQDTLSRAEWPYYQAISADYLATVGTPVLRGRSFSAGDAVGTEPVAIVNTSMAAAMWPNQEALGKCLYRAGGGCTRVVGVAVDTKRMSLIEDAEPLFYVPLTQDAGDRIDALYVRMHPGAGDPTALVRRMMETMPGQPYSEVRSLAGQIAGQRESWLHAASLFSIFSALGLLLAAIGTFSVLSYGVTQRTREIGVRMALGARHVQVIRMIVRQGMGAALAGIAVGGIGAWFFARAIGSLLYDVPPTDPLVFGTTSAILLMVALGAAWLPARRAARIDPMTALRAD